ncbi:MULTISPECIES: RDD family protein [unclassified Novosphingobium]|uniref:RDD family protein n=1 Tax=unclassified Novosphingobium TaxID=2644732 RepID=UPI00135C2D76|nr:MULTISPECIES: RDD family protein [unclassified Novosphingobium]
MVPNGGFWWRVLAYIIDAIILNVASSIIGGIFGAGFAFPLMGMGNVAAVSGAMFGMVAVSIVVNWLYFALMESSKLQATIGKLAVGLVVTDLTGARVSFLRATGRYFGKILSSAILCIGFIMAAFTERKQGLHDLLAGTLVYKTRDPQQVYNSADVFA